MGKIVFTIGETMKKLSTEDNEITKNKIAVESKVRPATIAALVNGEAKRIELDTLLSILDTLNKFNKDNKIKIGVDSIFVYKK